MQIWIIRLGLISQSKCLFCVLLHLAACGRSVQLRKDFTHIFLVMWVQGKAPKFCLVNFSQGSGNNMPCTVCNLHIQTVLAARWLNIKINNLNMNLQWCCLKNEMASHQKMTTITNVLFPQACIFNRKLDFTKKEPHMLTLKYTLHANRSLLHVTECSF